MKKVYLLLLSLVVLMIALTGCGKDTDSAKDNSKPITLRYSTMQNKDHISYQVALNIKQAVEEKTEGMSSHRQSIPQTSWVTGLRFMTSL